MKISLKTAEYLNKAIEKINYEHDMIESFSEDASAHVRFTNLEFAALRQILNNLELEIK